MLAKWIIEVSENFIDPAAVLGHRSSKTARKSAVIQFWDVQNLKLETKHEGFFFVFLCVCEDMHFPKKKKKRTTTQAKLQNSVHMSIEDATIKTHALTYLLFPHRVEHVSAAVARKCYLREANAHAFCNNRSLKKKQTNNKPPSGKEEHMLRNFMFKL